MPTDFGGDVNNATDSNSIATEKWQDVFKDEQLKKLIDTALAYNYDLKQAIQRIELAQANFKQRKSALLPSLDLAAEAGLRKYGFYTESGIGNYDSNFSENLQSDEKIPGPAIPDYFVGVRASWELDLWGKIKAQKNAAFNNLLASNEARRLIETEIISNIATAYYELISLDGKILVFDRNIALNERALEIIELQKEAGRSSLLAVEQFKAFLANAKAQRSHTKQEISILENHINYLSGRFNKPINREAKQLTQLSLFDSLQLGTPIQLIAQRPDIREAAFQLMSAEEEIKSARAAFLPAIVLSPYLGLQSFSLNKLVNIEKSLSYGLTGGLTAPIFNQQALKAQYASYKANHGINFLEYEKKVLNAYNEVASALQIQEHIAERQLYISEQVLALKAAVDAAGELFIAGRVSYLDIITAQKDALEAQIDEVDIQKERIINQILIYKALGGGWK